MADNSGSPPAAQALADLEHERLSSLINSMADGVLALGEDGKVVLSNGAALNILDVNIARLHHPCPRRCLPGRGTRRRCPIPKRRRR